jgi:hypothetical protein
LNTDIEVAIDQIGAQGIEGQGRCPCIHVR